MVVLEWAYIAIGFVLGIVLLVFYSLFGALLVTGVLICVAGGTIYVFGKLFLDPRRDDYAGHVLAYVKWKILGEKGSFVALALWIVLLMCFLAASELNDRFPG